MRLIDVDAFKAEHRMADMCGDCKRTKRELDCDVCDCCDWLDNAPTVSEWISVKDRMPPELHSMWFPLYGTPKWRNVMWREESDLVLVAVVFDDGTRYVSMGRTHDGEWNTNISKVVHNTVTHWMPLPTPPEVKQDGKT